MNSINLIRGYVIEDLLIFAHGHYLPSCVCLFVLRILPYLKLGKCFFSVLALRLTAPESRQSQREQLATQAHTFVWLLSFWWIRKICSVVKMLLNAIQHWIQHRIRPSSGFSTRFSTGFQHQIRFSPIMPYINSLLKLHSYLTKASCFSLLLM